MFNLGQAYKLGDGVMQNVAQAEALFGQAANLGHIQASDNYGLLLFQRGQRSQALPFIRAAADRGDPRAQYLLGIAHFNGDIVGKDWIRAYALVGLAQQAGWPQAAEALSQMDQHLPMAQRQQAIALAAELRSQADASRVRQLAAEDLRPPVPASPASTSARPVAVRKGLPPSISAAPPSEPWRIQLGAFGQPGNADALWERLKRRPEMTGKSRFNVKAGAVTKLQAGGFPNEAAARTACQQLSAIGQTCLALQY
jgi:cell division septation protein DedD